MNRLSFRQIRKTIARSTRTLLNAFLAASLLLGLIPPPLVTTVADLTGFRNLSGLADILPELSVAEAAPLEAPASVGDIAPAFAPSLQTSTITGSVFRDYDVDGTKDANEPFLIDVSSVTVTAYDASSSAVGTTTVSTTDGSYTLNVTGSGPFRLEFTGLPPWLKDGVVGSGSASTVQFANDGDTINLAVHNPVDYCQAEPPLTVACYLQPLDATATAWTDEPAIVQIPYESGTTATDTTAIDTVEDEAFKTILATNGEVGSVFGLAFDQGEGIIYTSAFMKRHVPYGPAGVDAIYKIDGTGVSTFMNLNALLGGTPAGADEHSPNGNNYQEDDVWDAVGKSSFAGLAISQDGSTLYVVTMTDADRQLYKINVPADGTNPLAADVQSFALPSPADCPAHPSTGGGELNHNLRPGALEYSDGTLYVGLTCTAESTQSTADLKGYVYAFDPTNDTFASTPLLTIPFNYSRTNVTSNPVVAPGAFNPWTTVQMTFATSPALNGRDDNASYPMPWLMDIGFADDGCMVLGIADRFGHLSSGRNSPPEQLNGNAGGDILKACNLAGSWTLENNGNDGVNPATAGAGTNAGPGNGEFFHDEAFDMVSDTYHTEISNGAFAILRGKEEVVLGVYDPAPRPGTLPNGATAFDSGGLAYLSTVDGSRTRSYMLFNRLENGGETGNGFDKASATGDIVAFCDAAPIEIGNRVWWDDNLNGVQDPGTAEGPIAGVTLELHLVDAADSLNPGDDLATVGSTLVATTETDAQGRYYFSGADDSTNVKVPAGYEAQTWLVGTEVLQNRTYQVRIPDWDGSTGTNAANNTAIAANLGAGETLFLAPGPNTGTGSTNVKPSSDSAAINTIQDTDAYDNPGNAAIVVDTGAAGENNHSLDFAFGGNIENATVNLGNQVWEDVDNDGLYEPGDGETGIQNVVVELYQDTNGDGSFTLGIDTFVTTTTTSATGLYTFTNLVATTNVSTTYLVVISNTNFSGAGPLVGYLNSDGNDPPPDPDDDVDDDDNGSTSGTLGAGGLVVSQPISLTVGSEPFTTTVSGDSNWTVDFGFMQASTVTLVKNTVDTDGTFTFSAADADLNGLSLTTVGNTATSSVITKTAGLYNLTEDAVNGWTLTNIVITGDDGDSTVDVANRSAAIQLSAGEDVTVTFTNTPDPSTIAIVKQTEEGDGTFTFTSSDADLDAVSLTTISNTATSNIFTKVAGLYTITEDALTDWAFRGISLMGDTDGGSTIDTANQQAVVDLDPGEHITVTFNNAPPTAAVSVEKTLVSPASGRAEQGETLTYALRVENSGDIDLNELTLSDVYDPRYLSYDTASIPPDSQTSDQLTWTGTTSSGSLQANLPLAAGAAFTITVEFTATQP